MNLNSDIQVAITRFITALQNDTDLRKISAAKGSKYLGVTSFSAESFTSLYIREDTIITVLAGYDINGNSVNYLTDMGLSGITLKAGDLYIIPNGCKITSGTITSGSVIGYR